MSTKSSDKHSTIMLIATVAAALFAGASAVFAAHQARLGEAALASSEDLQRAWLEPTITPKIAFVVPVENPQIGVGGTWVDVSVKNHGDVPAIDVGYKAYLDPVPPSGRSIGPRKGPVCETVNKGEAVFPGQTAPLGYTPGEASLAEIKRAAEGNRAAFILSVCVTYKSGRSAKVHHTRIAYMVRERGKGLYFDIRETAVTPQNLYFEPLGAAEAD